MQFTLLLHDIPEQHMYVTQAGQAIHNRCGGQLHSDAAASLDSHHLRDMLFPATETQGYQPTDHSVAIAIVSRSRRQSRPRRRAVAGLLKPKHEIAREI